MQIIYEVYGGSLNVKMDFRAFSIPINILIKYQRIRVKQKHTETNLSKIRMELCTDKRLVQYQ